MRIVMFVDRFPVLSETFILTQITGLLDLGHDVEIFPLRPGGDSVSHPDVARYRLNERVCRAHPSALGRVRQAAQHLATLWRRAPVMCWRALNIARFGREAYSLRLLHWASSLAVRPPYDVALCHFGPSGITAQHLRDVGVLDASLVTVFHGWDLSRFLREQGAQAYADLFARGELFLPVSERWARRLRELGCAPERVRVHHMGIDPGRFPYRPRRLEPGEPVRVLSIARLVEKKGLEYAIRAVAQYTSRPDARPLEYRIVGDGERRAALAALVDALGLTGTVTLVGHQTQDKVIQEIARAHLMLAPSVTSQDGDEEGIPVVLMEVMASGLPVITTEHSGISELVDAGTTGLVVPERDVAALTTALQELIAAADSWPQQGLAGRAKVEHEFDVRRLNQTLVETLEGVSAQGREAGRP